MAELIIRSAKENDVDQICQLEEQCFATPWSRDSVYHDICDNKLAFYLVADLDDTILGYAGIWNIVDEGHITNVAVSPQWRQKHIGSYLLHHLLELTEKVGIKSHTLEVRKSNEPALGLYKSFGFVEEGIRKGYYADNGEDAIIMWRRQE